MVEFFWFDFSINNPVTRFWWLYQLCSVGSRASRHSISEHSGLGLEPWPYNLNNSSLSQYSVLLTLCSNAKMLYGSFLLFEISRLAAITLEEKISHKNFHDCVKDSVCRRLSATCGIRGWKMQNDCVLKNWKTYLEEQRSGAFCSLVQVCVRKPKGLHWRLKSSHWSPKELETNI